MKKSVINSLVLVSAISLFFAVVPNVFSQPENVEVLSYSWYTTEFGLVVVGEVQNVGPNIIDTISLRGTIFTTDGWDQAVSSTRAYADQILPQQKVPFYMYFLPENSYTGDFSWFSIGIDHVAFEIIYANQTDYYQYPDLSIMGDTSYIDPNGYYAVTGFVQNTGNQEASKLLIVASFYNASGDVIAVEYSDYLTPESLSPGQTTSFTVTTFDAPIGLSNQITDYALLIHVESPIIPEFPSFIILVLFMVAPLVGVIIYRRRLIKRANE